MVFSCQHATAFSKWDIRGDLAQDFWEILLTSQELEFFHALKVLQMMIMLEGGSVALSLTWFWGDISPGTYNIKDERIVCFPEDGTRGDLETFAALGLGYWVRF